MLALAEIGAGQIFRVFLATLPEIALWVIILGGLGLGLGIAMLMGCLRWMLPWQPLHQLRQQVRGWIWMILQWSWVITWAISMPTLTAAIGGLTGSAFGARSLVHKENVGQVLGERILGPICYQIALQLQKNYPQMGDMTHKKLDATSIKLLMENVSPTMLDAALKKVHLLDDADPKASPMEQAGRRFARRGIERAAQLYFNEKTRFVSAVLKELKQRGQEQATLHQVVCCASHLYFTPAFARWTFWWILAHAGALIPVLGGIWLTPWALFKLFWWWHQRKLAQNEVSDRVSGIQSPGT